MEYIILVFVVLISLVYFEKIYKNILQTKKERIDFILNKMKEIFDGVIKVTYHSAQRKDSLFYIIEKADKTQEVLHIHHVISENLIEFYYIDFNYFYSANQIGRYDGDFILRIDLKDLEIPNNSAISFVRNFFPDIDMFYNEINNSKVIFDTLYHNLVNMKRISEGASITVLVQNSKFIQNLYK